MSTTVEYHPENGDACWVAVTTLPDGGHLWMAYQEKAKAEAKAAERNASV